jgi:hypothetical protein
LGEIEHGMMVADSATDEHRLDTDWTVAAVYDRRFRTGFFDRFFLTVFGLSSPPATEIRPWLSFYSAKNILDSDGRNMVQHSLI